MVEEYEDDFDRFCRIGMGTGSEYSPLRPIHRDFLAAPTELCRNRAGSLRETRHRLSHRYDGAGTRGRFARTTTTDDFGVQGDSTYNLRRHSLAPSIQNLRTRGTLHYPSEDISDDRSNLTRPLTPIRQISPPPRNGGSGGVCPPPINVYHEIDSPGRHGTNVVRVRSFRRTKTGVVDETEKKRRLSQEISSPIRKTSKTRSLKAPPGELKLSDRCETARSIRRRSFTDNSWLGNSINNSTTNVNNSNTNVAAEGSEVENETLGQVTEPYKVQVLGADQVGKTTMCTQFLTSESLDAGYDTANRGNVLETITVDVDGQQTSLLLIDSDSYEHPNFAVIDSADAYLVVYAIDDRESFKGAQTIVSEILGRCKIASAIVLVGNKTDLVRARSVSYDEGKHLASVYSCDFYEVSISLNHQVNELLVGLVSAIKAANQHVNEERQRLSRIASLKGNPLEASSSHEHRTSIKQKLQHSRRYSNMGKSIRHFFKKHFSLNGT